MVAPSYLKALHPLQAFSMKKHSPSSSISSMKIKTLIHTLIFSHLCRLIRALSKAKSVLVEILKENLQLIHLKYPTKSSSTTKKIKNNKKNRKIFFGSFRLHYNWCSSHVVPVPAPVLDGLSATHLYYDSTWNSFISTHDHQEGTESQLSGYLHWLEEKVEDDNHSNTTDHHHHQVDINEIDKLADMFIADCHEKFRLEKQESYRRFQEMLARSM